MELNWKNPEKELPKESGSYLTYLKDSHAIHTYRYSKVHKKFNANDWEDASPYAIKVDLWAKFPAREKFSEYLQYDS